MKNKRFLAVLCLLLCVVLAFTFVGCNNDDGKDNGKDNGVKPTDKVTVTFKNGDTVVDTIEINKGTAVAATTKTVTAPEGKQFKSWQKDGVDYDFTAKVNENITLVATFEDIPAPAPSTFTITFKDADGKVLKTIPVARGQYIAAADVPTAPDKSAEHKTFVRWVDENDPLVSLDYDSEVYQNATYVPEYATVKFTVTFTEANGVTTWETQTLEYGGTIGTLDLPAGYIIESVKNGTEDFDLTSPVTSDLNLTITLKEVKYNVTFRDGDGKEIATVSVPVRGNATLPTPANKTYWTATAEEYAKLFNVTEERTITLGTTASDKYKGNKTWINSAAGGNTAKELFNADFETGAWALVQPPFQKDGAYFTVTGNFAKFSARFYINKGDTCEYNIYVDGILVKTLKLEASADAIFNDTVELVGPENMTAGMHTIKVEVVKTAQIQVLEGLRGPDIKDNYDVIFKDAAGNEFFKTTVANGTTVTAPESNPTKTAFLFKEWQLNGKKYDFSTPVTEDIVLTPAWDFDTENYIKVKFTVDGSAYGNELYIEKNGTVTKPTTDPTKDKHEFKFWTVDGKTAFDFSTALTADTEIKAHFEVVANKYTVTYKDAEGNVLGTVLVIEGETARLPEAPEGYYWTCTMADLANITADKDIVLGKVDASLYPKAASNNWNLTVNKTPDEQVTKYDVVKEGGNDQNWGFVFYKKGSYVQFTADIAGELRFGGNCEKNGQHFVLGLYIDDVLYKTINIDTPTPFSITADTNLPAGVHTYRIEILSVTYDEGGDAPGMWSGIVWTAIGFQEKTSSTETEA